jgi:hypothetical protein
VALVGTSKTTLLILRKTISLGRTTLLSIMSEHTLVGLGRSWRRLHGYLRLRLPSSYIHHLSWTGWRRAGGSQLREPLML